MKAPIKSFSFYSDFNFGSLLAPKFRKYFFIFETFSGQQGVVYRYYAIADVFVLPSIATKDFKEPWGLVVNEAAWPVMVGDRTIQYAPIKTLIENPDFDAHVAAATACGFELFVKRAKIGAAKHVRVRPRFDEWAISGSITVFDEMITNDVLTNILTFAGTYAGLGDWRPSSPKSPGPFGKFTVAVRKA